MTPDTPLITRLLSLIELSEKSNETLTNQLGVLARACTLAVQTETNEADFTQARFAEAVRQIELVVNEEVDERRQDVISFSNNSGLCAFVTSRLAGRWKRIVNYVGG